MRTIGTLGIQLQSGRNFSAEMPTDSDAIIINQAAANLLSYKDPINQKWYTPLDNFLQHIRSYHIIGVIKDFNFRPLRQNVTPLILHLEEDRGALSVRIHGSADIQAVMAGIRNKWKELLPTREFAWSFMEEDFDALYRTEQRMGKLFVSYTSFAIPIACSGLFGLAAYAAEQRNKEIGIRRVLGAEVSTIVGMLSKDFIKLVVIDILIASPLAWLAMRPWLQGFAYRQDMQWWVFGLAAMVNPAECLKSE